MDSETNGSNLNAPVSASPFVLYKSLDGRLWAIDEGHPETDATVAVCRAFERGTLQHSAVWARSDLTLYTAEMERAARGGSAGTGDAKRRPPEHYARLAELKRQRAKGAKLLASVADACGDIPKARA